MEEEGREERERMDDDCRPRTGQADGAEGASIRYVFTWEGGLKKSPILREKKTVRTGLRTKGDGAST